MSDEKRPSTNEVSFLPPLRMVLAFFDRETHKRTMLKQEDTRPIDTKGFDVKRIIDRLNEKDWADD